MRPSEQKHNMRVFGSSAFPDRHRFVGVVVTDTAAVTATDRRVGRTSADKRGVGGIGDKNTDRRVRVSSADKQRANKWGFKSTGMGVKSTGMGVNRISSDKHRIHVKISLSDSVDSFATFAEPTDNNRRRQWMWKTNEGKQEGARA